ncbi:dynein light chain, cytoplasmic [Fagus crenata]
MERLEAEKARARRVTVAKNKKEGVLCLYTPPSAGQKLALPPLHQPRAPSSEVKLKLAAVVVDLNVRLRLANMPPTMQERAFRHTRSLLDSTPEKKKPSPTHLAMCLKKEFDAIYGPAWHCIVGKSFGSFVTHSTGGFVYFSIDKLSFLLFKTVVRPVKSPLLLKLDK